MTVRSGWLAPTGQTREDTRIIQLGALTPTSPVASRSGILPGSSTGQYRVSGFTVNGSSAMAATVFPGRALIQGPDSQGAYPVALTEVQDITFADGDAQYGRIDLVVVRIYDDAYDASGRTEAAVEIVQGTPAAAPAAPAVPSLALPLYEVTVPAGTSAGTGGIPWSSAFTDRRTVTVAVGGVLPTSDSLPGSYPGQYRDLDGVLQRWDGSAWVAYPQGLGGIAPSGRLTSGSYTGQYQESIDGLLQRWDGSAWQYAEGRSTILFSASQTAKQSVASGTWTLLTLQTTDVDTAGGFNGTDTYTVPRTGWWRVSAHAAWSTDSTSGYRGTRVEVNGVGVSRATWIVGAGPSTTTIGGDCVVWLVAGDAVTVLGLQNSGMAVQTLGGSGYSCNLTAEWIRS